MRHAVEIMHEGSITVGRGYGAGALVRPAGDGDRRLLWCLLPPLWRALTNGGTVRLPRLAGMAHAMDLTLTGRKIEAAEALQMGLCNRVVPTGQALQAVLALARQLAGFAQATMLADRMSAYCQWDLPLQQEWPRGKQFLGDAPESTGQFAAGVGRHGKSWKEIVPRRAIPQCFGR